MITYSSTRGNKRRHTFSEVILKGIADDGGLFVPSSFPRLSKSDLKNLLSSSYQEIALTIFENFQTGIPTNDLQEIINKAYGSAFDTKVVAPVVQLEKNYHMLELWHGPTAAFKDMALQIMPLFFEYAMQREAISNKYIILVATSGDTGSAALEGYKDKKNISVLAFYPDKRVSLIQELQMVTQTGKNVSVIAMQGNFDDAQRSIKEVFADKAFAANLLKKHKTILSSANSINWGRLMPQIVYHISAYLQLVEKGVITLGDHIDIAVPSGNFGNLLAALYAKEMGLPVRKFICASNENNVLTTFLQTGVYDISKRTMIKTPSPSMDILVANNIERLLFFLTSDSQKVSTWMSDLRIKKQFCVDTQTKTQMKELFFADWVSNEDNLTTIKKVFKETGYLMDTHTAVCEAAAERFSKKEGVKIPLIVCSTAHFAKFPQAVCLALTGKISTKNDFELLQEIHTLAPKVLVPKHISELASKKIIHKRKSKKGKDAVEELILQICQ